MGNEMQPQHQTIELPQRMLTEVSGYSMQTGVSVDGTPLSEKAIQGNYAARGGQAIYTDRPTITHRSIQQ